MTKPRLRSATRPLRMSAATTFASLLVVVAVLSGCGSNADTTARSDQGPNPTHEDPGPNSTTADPGPNPTNDAVQTLSGTLSIDANACATLTLDGRETKYSLAFKAPYATTTSGVTTRGAQVAVPGARLFVTGRPTNNAGRCGGTSFRVVSLNSVQNP